AARQATIAALAQAARPGEKPDLVWISSTPGAEETVLDGIASVVGTDVPIIGGSAADNDVGGAWFVGDAATHCAEGVAVAVLFPSTAVSFAYQSGYAPTGKRGRATRARGRMLYEIDGRPAAEVYQAWTGGAVAAPADGTQPILAEATLWPLGREVAHLGPVPYHLLAHPAAADGSGALHLFADICEGETLCQMEGSIDGLAARAGRVVTLARRAGGLAADEVAGAFVIYCGGCMMTLSARIDEVVASIRADLGTAPFAGTFTFGEQGPIIGSGNRHGNLMISCIIFAK
ncbi:MAG: FIST C-terminal domain-containing protein, partial [Pseudomonadota bacterium]